MTTDRPWSEDGPGDPTPDLADPVRAIRDAIPTSRHARMLFDMVAQIVGEESVIETTDGRTGFTLLRREAPGARTIIPWPLLRLGTGGRVSTTVTLMAPPGVPDTPPPRAGSAPRLRGLGPGELVIEDGRQKITVTYGDDGRWMETSESEDVRAFTGVLPLLARRSARPVELLAEYVAALDLRRHGPGRVQCPVPLPSVHGVWSCGLFALREALFDGRVPDDARWAIADGYAGTAIGWGATREEALSAWEAEVRRLRPRLLGSDEAAPRVENMVERHEEEPGIWSARMTLGGPSSDGAWPESAPENTPAVMIPLEPNARPPTRWGSWVRLLGGFGTTVHALLRRDALGFTLVGDRLADRVELHDLDDKLDAVKIFDHPRLDEARARWSGDRPGDDCRTVEYRLVDDRTHEPVVASVVEARRGREFQPRTLDGDHLHWRVVRQRRLS